MAAPNFYPDQEKPIREFRWGGLYDAFAVAMRFFLEVAATIAIFAFCAYPLSTMGPPGGVLMLLELLLGFAYCLGMLGARYRALRKRAGGAHWSVTALLAACLVLPPAFVAESAASNLNRFRFKARQSEAKIALAALYAAEQSYYREHHAYAMDIHALGYEPEGMPRFYVEGAPLACSNQQGLRQDTQLWSGREAPQLAARKAAVEDSLHALRRPSECRDPREGFELVAVGVPDPSGRIDVWTINEKKELKNEVQGI